VATVPIRDASFDRDSCFSRRRSNLSISDNLDRAVEESVKVEESLKAEHRLSERRDSMGKGARLASPGMIGQDENRRNSAYGFIGKAIVPPTPFKPAALESPDSRQTPRRTPGSHVRELDGGPTPASGLARTTAMVDIHCIAKAKIPAERRRPRASARLQACCSLAIGRFLRCRGLFRACRRITSRAASDEMSPMPIFQSNPSGLNGRLDGMADHAAKLCSIWAAFRCASAGVRESTDHGYGQITVPARRRKILERS